MATNIFFVFVIDWGIINQVPDLYIVIGFHLAVKMSLKARKRKHDVITENENLKNENNPTNAPKVIHYTIQYILIYKQSLN